MDKEMKKKGNGSKKEKDYSEDEEMLKTLSDDDLEIMYQAYPSNKNLKNEWKRRGKEKMK